MVLVGVMFDHTQQGSVQSGGLLSLLVSFTYSLVFSRMDTVMSLADRRWRAKAFGSSESDWTIFSLQLTSTL